MPEISQEAIREAYAYALRVYRNQITAAEARRSLVAAHRMNGNTAADIIGNVRKLLDGELYTRTNNAYATDYFLGRILREFGPAALETALHAVDLHLKYYESLRDTRLHRVRAIRNKYRAILSHELPSLDEINRQLADAVGKSQSLSPQSRRERIRAADRKPQRIQVSATVFARSPDVIAEVLARADGQCEKCRQPAPFLRASDGSPYLEVHHIVTLANGGDDTPENAKALCPNCHRKAHYV